MNTIISLSFCGVLMIAMGYVITFWFRSMKAFDKLIQYQFEHFNEQWVMNGEPHGMFWSPPQESSNIINRFIRSNPASSILYLTFFTPGWVKESTDAQFLLRRARVFGLAWNVGVVLWFALFSGLILLSR